jgi:hypothetical protein
MQTIHSTLACDVYVSSLIMTWPYSSSTAGPRAEKVEKANLCRGAKWEISDAKQCADNAFIPTWYLFVSSLITTWPCSLSTAGTRAEQVGKAHLGGGAKRPLFINQSKKVEQVHTRADKCEV